MTAQHKRTEETGTHVKILAAAASLFRSRGYEATTLRGIAAECGLKAGSIYYHFSSKDEILAEVLDFGIKELHRNVREAVGALPAGASRCDAIAAATRRHLECMLEFGDFTATNIRVFSQAPVEIQKRALVARREYEAYWKSLFTDARDAGEIRGDIDLSIARLFLFGGMSWTLEWYRDGGLDARELADLYTGILLRGIAN